MSGPDADAGDGPDDRIAERILRQDEFAGDLDAQGYTDVLVLRRENGCDVLTESRLERHGEVVESVRDLARRLDRDKGAVSKGLRRLAELDVVEYEGDGDGEAKRSVLKHQHLVMDPLGKSSMLDSCFLLAEVRSSPSDRISVMDTEAVFSTDSVFY